MAITVQEAQVVFSADGLTQVKSKAGEAGRALDKTTTAAGGLISKLKGVRLNLGGIGSTLAGLGFGAAAGKMMSLAASAEQTAISMEVFLGSAEKAKTLIENLRALDMNSVFGFQELADAAKMMLNFGVAGEEVMGSLTRISEIAAGDSMRLEAIARGFGQITQAGRLMGQENNQLINAGFSPLAEISRKTGESMADLKKRMEDGGVSVEEVKQAFISATSAGGRFYGLNERLAASTAGQFGKLKSEVSLLAIAMGTELLPIANELLEWARSFFTSTDKVSSSFGSIATKAREFFDEARQKFAGLGVIVGVTAVHFADHFRVAFDDIRSLSAAVFDWMTIRLDVFVKNTESRLKALKQMAMGQEVNQFLLPSPRFNMPESKGGQIPPLINRIQEELRAAAEMWEAMNTRRPGAGAGEQGFDMGALANPLTRGGSNIFTVDLGPPKKQNETAEARRSQTLSAEALFGSLRESALSQQSKMQKEQISIAQQQLEVQQAQVVAINNLNLGLT